jgi:hypothetical protein
MEVTVLKRRAAKILEKQLLQIPWNIRWLCDQGGLSVVKKE